MKDIIKTSSAPSAIGPYSQGIVVGDLVFCSGQIALDPVSGKLIGSEIVEQTNQVLKNITALLASQGLDFSNVVKTTVFLADIQDFTAMNEVYANYFVEPYPARSAVQVANLPKGALVEIEVIAHK